MTTNTILESSIYKQGGCEPSSIVLCHITHNDHTPFVTWIKVYPVESDRYPATLQGNYFDDLQDALNDYNERATRLHHAAERSA